MCILLPAYGQEVGDRFPDFEKPSELLFYFGESASTQRILKEQLPDFKNYQVGKKYDKIVYDSYGDLKWFSGALEEIKSGAYTFKVDGAVKYLSNNQLYYEKYNKDGIFQLKVFYENGILWKDYYEYPYPNGESERVFDKEGLLVREHSKEFIAQKEHPYAGTMIFDYVSPKKGYPPNYQSYENGDSYLGYQHVGTLFTNDGLEITGFFTSLEYDRGNGGVFFVENRSTGSCSWITVVNKKIILVAQATCDELPDIHAINNEMTSLGYTWKIDKLSKEDKKNLGFTGDDLKGKLGFKKEVVEVTSSSNELLNGYHFKMTPTKNAFPNDGLTITCGVYKNGVLNGMGFKTAIDCKNGKYATYSGYGIAGLFSATWNMQAGLFENGVLKKGRDFSTKNSYNRSTQDIFTPSGIENYEYVGINSNTAYTETLKITNVRVGSDIFSKQLGRFLKVLSIDHKTGDIVVPTDVEGVTHTFNILKDDIFLSVKDNNPVTITCKTVKEVPIYKERKVLLYYSSAIEKTNLQTKKGVYYNKKFKTTTYYDAIYSKKFDIVGYETVVCPICAGRGYTTNYYYKTKFVKVIF